MLWLIGLLLVVFVADALKLRKRAGGVLESPDDAGPVSPGWEIVAAAGVNVSDATAAGAVKTATEQGIEVLDLAPANLPALQSLGLLQLYDPATYRTTPFATGRTAGHAVACTSDVYARAGAPETFTSWAAGLRRYAARSADLAVAPGLSARPEDDANRWALLKDAAGSMAFAVVVAQPLMIGLLVWAVIAEPLWGAILVAVFNLQPLVALSGSVFRPKDLAAVTLLRPLFELDGWRRTLQSALNRDRGDDPVEVRRPKYEKWTKDGLGAFFEPRRDDCPLCEATALSRVIEVPDQYQYKPGTFRLDRCDGCGHVFQNPRLTIEGLNFYYSDFYDGLGESGLEGIFGWSAEPYFDRAKMLQGIATPTRWLDVGTGHGHFCCAARESWPEATFDGLDLSESIEEAERRRWVDHGYRGLFPDLASEHAGRYDVVSMHHYLEHTREPKEELEAAHQVLEPGGHLLIEVPDPDCKTGRWFGRFWLPWFQPQHQHFVSVANLERLFEKVGFEAITWHRGEAHQTVDLLFATMIFFGQLAPNPNLPWREKVGLGGRIWHALVWTIGTPICLLAWAADQVFQRFFRKAGRSNTYRVLARRV